MKPVEEILKKQLTADFVPGDVLNKSVLNQAKETYHMKHYKNRSKMAAAAAVAVILAGSFGTFAAYQYLKPSQVAERLKGDKIAAAFEREGAVSVSETQIINGYQVTFLGTVSGKNLEGAVEDPISQELEETKTYAVVAIGYLDGTPMPEVSDPDYKIFCISPLIQGKTFWEMNNGILNAGVSSFVQDGIQYELLECDNLEIFGYLRVSLGVVESFGQETEAFDYDEATGTYSRNTKYEGINGLFELPLDPSKADEKAAEEYFAQAAASDGQEDTEEAFTGNLEIDTVLAQVMEAGKADQDTWSVFLAHTKELTEYSQTVKEDDQGYVKFWNMDHENQNQYYVGDDSYEEGIETISGAESDGTFEGTIVSTLTVWEDGTCTIRYYQLLR